ncbi:hypothetical protein, partial [Salmonella sp. s55033]|uniref:hypothetical protein n=1 Tax=Salmonella sp. s55033 TaxID=3159676 RepID=UPI00397EE57E
MDSITDEKECAKTCLEKAGMNEELFRTGNTKVFFRAGALGTLEEIRDDKLAALMTAMQSVVRGFTSRKDYKRLQEQRVALIVVQRNLRKFMQMRTWPWYRLWQRVKPLLNVTRIEDEMKALEEKAEKA